MANIFTRNPYMQSATSNNGVYYPNGSEIEAQRSLAYQTPTQASTTLPGTTTPFQIQQKPLVLNQSFPGSQGVTTPTIGQIPPVQQPDIASLSAQIASIQNQANQLQQEKATAEKALQTQQAQQAQPVEQQQQSSTEKMWQALMGQQSQIQQQVQTSQQNLLNQQNAIYEQWGLTPEKYNRIQDITSQVGEYQKQLAAIETREQQAIDALQTRPEIDIANMGAEQARISRAYAIQKSGVAAQASALVSEAQALQGNWDNAFKSAQLYVDNATKAQQQYVSDLKWGFEQYKDIISTMTADEQKRINDVLDFQTSQLKLQETQAQNDINNQLRLMGIQLSAESRDTLNALREAQVAQLTQAAPGQYVNAVTGFPVKLTADQITNFQRFDQYKNDLIPIATTLLDPNSPEKVGTGGLAGRYMKTVQNLPGAQRTLNQNQNKLLATIATMNNQLIYMLSGKQINESEYNRLKEQLPDVTLTNEQNMTRINMFNNLLNQAEQKQMRIMGIAEAGGSPTQSNLNNDPLGIR